MKRVKKAIIAFILMIAISVCSVGVNTQKADAFVLGWLAKKAAKAVARRVVVKAVTGGVKRGYQYKQKNFKVNPKPRKIYVKGTVRLKPLLCYGNKIKWSSSNKVVASVSQAGVVKGKRAGKATITAVPSISRKVSRIKVTVKAYPKTKKTPKAKTPKPTKRPKKDITPKPVTAPEETETPRPTEPPVRTENPETPYPVETLKPSEKPQETEIPEPKETPSSSESPLPTKQPILPSEGDESNDEFIVTKVCYGEEVLEYIQNGDRIEVQRDGFVSLQERFPDVDEIGIYAALPDDTMAKEAVVTDVLWCEEPYYSSSEDNGYYQMTVKIPCDGKWLYRKMFLVEQLYQDKEAQEYARGERLLGKYANMLEWWFG